MTCHTLKTYSSNQLNPLYLYKCVIIKSHIYNLIQSQIRFPCCVWKLRLQLRLRSIHPIIFLSGEYYNTLRPGQNVRHFAEDIFKFIFNENCWIPIKISLMFVQIMAWRHSGDKPLSEPMMASLPRHISVTRPQWDNIPSDDSVFRRIFGWIISKLQSPRFIPE